MFNFTLLNENKQIPIPGKCDLIVIEIHDYTTLVVFYCNSDQSDCSLFPPIYLKNIPENLSKELKSGKMKENDYVTLVSKYIKSNYNIPKIPKITIQMHDSNFSINLN